MQDVLLPVIELLIPCVSSSRWVCTWAWSAGLGCNASFPSEPFLTACSAGVGTSKMGEVGLFWKSALGFSPPTPLPHVSGGWADESPLGCLGLVLSSVTCNWQSRARTIGIQKMVLEMKCVHFNQGGLSRFTEPTAPHPTTPIPGNGGSQVTLLPPSPSLG